MHLQDLVRRWRLQQLALLPAETPENVRETFARVGYLATPDVLRIYTTIGGMQEMDEDYLRLWSLQEIESENRGKTESGLLFADYMIDCWCYRLRPEGEVRSSVYVDYFDGKPAILVARSLIEFFDVYAQEPAKVHAY